MKDYLELYYEWERGFNDGIKLMIWAVAFAFFFGLVIGLMT